MLKGVVSFFPAPGTLLVYRDYTCNMTYIGLSFSAKTGNINVGSDSHTFEIVSLVADTQASFTQQTHIL